MDISQMKTKLRGMMSEKRYLHSLGVMDTAVHLARLYGADVKKAELAGLLHDCAKDIPKSDMLSLCDKYGIILDDIKKQQLSLVHADLGTEVCKRAFGVDDAEVLNAIKYHTLGREKMSVLEKIIYLADFTEPNRTPFDGLDNLRRECKKDLDMSMYIASSMAIEFVKSKGKVLHNQTYKTMEYYKEKVHI